MQEFAFDVLAVTGVVVDTAVGNRHDVVAESARVSVLALSWEDNRTLNNINAKRFLGKLAKCRAPYF